MGSHRDSGAAKGVLLKASALVFLLVGIISVGLGFAFVTASVVPQSRNTGFQLPTGLYYYTYLRIETLTPGRITVTYQASPGPVDQYILTPAQYAVFQTHATTDTMYSTSGSSGTFSVPLPSGGTYYLVTTHASGYEFTPQSGTHSTTVWGLAPTPFYAAVIAFTAGLVVLVIGLWLRTKPARTAPAPPGSSMGPSQVPTAGPPPAFAPIRYGTVLVTLENPSAADTIVQLFVNGQLVTSLNVAAGMTAGATLHPGLVSVYGTPVRVEAVTADGRRASQELVATAYVAVSIALRIPGGSGSSSAAPAA